MGEKKHNAALIPCQFCSYGTETRGYLPVPCKVYRPTMEG